MTQGNPGDALTIPTPTKDGYTFVSWDVTPSSTFGAANTLTTYTAQWKANSGVVPTPPKQPGVPGTPDTGLTMLLDAAMSSSLIAIMIGGASLLDGAIIFGRKKFAKR